MTTKIKIKKIIESLTEYYPTAACALYADKPHELLIAVRLSAQCTDKRVNIVTPALFERFTTLNDFADADITEIEKYIKTCGLYKTKAKDIKEMCIAILDRFNGEVPHTIDELISLPGIGRKTANLIAGDVYGMEGAVVVDTHFIRLVNRIGLIDTKNTLLIEREMRKLLPASESLSFCHRIVTLGREICKAANPQCDICPISEFCDKNAVKR